MWTHEIELTDVSKARLGAYSGIGRAACAGAVVDAAERGCVLRAGPVREAVDGLVADIPDTEVLIEDVSNQHQVLQKAF